MNPFAKPMPDFSLEDFSTLEWYIRGSGSITGMWSDMDFEFLKSVEKFKQILVVEPWRKDALIIPFKDLPLYLSKDLHKNHWHTQIWSDPVIKWRLQIGK